MCAALCPASLCFGSCSILFPIGSQQTQEPFASHVTTPTASQPARNANRSGSESSGSPGVWGRNVWGQQARRARPLSRHPSLLSAAQNQSSWVCHGPVSDSVGEELDRSEPSGGPLVRAVLIAVMVGTSDTPEGGLPLCELFGSRFCRHGKHQ